jgi:hypothetical protein
MHAMRWDRTLRRSIDMGAADLTTGVSAVSVENPTDVGVAFASIVQFLKR